jgi:hypothetical protein
MIQREEETVIASERNRIIKCSGGTAVCMTTQSTHNGIDWVLYKKVLDKLQMKKPIP